MTRLVVSLTTIPPRLTFIEPTLIDLLEQTADISEIRLNIPFEFRRFPGAEIDIPKFPRGITVRRVAEDFGPATKLLPTIQDYRDDDVEVIVCDDDQSYAPDWAQRFVDGRSRQPDACLVQKGYDLERRGPGLRYFPVNRPAPRARVRHKGLTYRLRRLASLFRYKDTPFVREGFLDILEGHRGFMVRPAFFPEDVFDIPEILWTVDDPWLSGHLTRNNVPIWLVMSPFRRDIYGDAHFTERLHSFVRLGHDRARADTACIEYFRNTYGIWSGPGEPS